MAQKSTGDGVKGGDIVRALIDLVILALLVCGAAFGGYWYGIHERLAPINAVAPGTPGALPATAVTPAADDNKQPATAAAASTEKKPIALTSNTVPAHESNSTPASESNAATAKKAKAKFWIASFGTDYIGNSITVSVNDNPVDSFFGPGKTVDVTRFVKHGDNTVTFEAKALGDEYNKHKGDRKAELKVQLVSGPQIQENFKSSDVLASFKRIATDSEGSTDTVHFNDGD